MKIVVNRCWGGFHLESWACKMLDIEYVDEIDRDDPRLVELIESRPDAGGQYSSLSVVEIPDDYYYLISDYDGMETVYISREPISVL